VNTKPQPTARASELIAQSDALVEEGRDLDAIDLLRASNLEQPDPDVERRLAQVRHDAYTRLEGGNGFAEWPVPIADLERSGPAFIPQIERGELDAEVVRRSILGHGCLRVQGLLDRATTEDFVDGIELALSIRAEGPEFEAQQADSWFNALPLPRDEAKWLGRHWVAGSGGLLTCDSPKLLFRMFEAYEAAGLHRVITDYLGERPVLGANKCTLRRVPTTANTDWHQDGAFLGAGIRALNVWVALSDCGVDSPGIDVVPRRFDAVVETGTGGAIFDWAVGPAVVEQLSVDAPVQRPEFSAGDALLFDDLFLHRTGVEPSMARPRYAIESWFFARSSYPEGQVPIVW
jgi:hypothetical protein